MGSQQMLMMKGQAATLFLLNKSVRLRGAANPTMTIASLGGSPTTQKAALSKWVKTGTTLETQIFSGYDGTNYTVIFWNGVSNGQLRVNNQTTLDVRTTPILRDPTAWYHLVVILDGTAAAGSRCKIYINGVRQATSLNTDSATAYSWGGSYAHRMSGSIAGAVPFFDGYFADTQLTIGQNNVVGDFGEFDSSGVWVPKAYTGSYGTSGFHLDYADASTVAALGLDSSGNGKNWTPTNISVTAGPTYDSMIDTPTNNFPTLSSIDQNAGTLSNGALTFAGTTSTFPSIRASAAVRTGKWWMEFGYTTWSGANNVRIGVCEQSKLVTATTTAPTIGVGYQSGTGIKLVDGVSSAYGVSFTTGDVIGLALDLDAAIPTAEFFKQTGGAGAFVSQGVISSATLAGIALAAFVEDGTSAGAPTVNMNFGQRPFNNTAIPSGFVAMSTANMTPVAPSAAGSFSGNGNANGPAVWTGGVPLTLSIDGSANLIGGATVDKTAGGFKMRSATNNAAGTRNYVATYAAGTNGAFAHPQPAQTNP